MSEYQSLLVVSFGGPEKRDDVMPFLKNVLRGRNVPEARMLEVAEHYYQFDGLSPINQQNRDLIQALQQDFDQQGIDLPIYFGNRNWHPMIPDTLSKMKQDGINKVAGLFYVWLQLLLGMPPVSRRHHQCTANGGNRRSDRR